MKNLFLFKKKIHPHLAAKSILKVKTAFSDLP